MAILYFTTEIAADKQRVWDTMMHPETYKEWVGAGWTGAYYDGVWEQGQEVALLSPGMGGTLMELQEVRPYEYLFAKHVAVVNPDGTQDRDSDTAKGWVGSTESYTLKGGNGSTMVKIEIHTTPEWTSMFEEGWPNALAKLKEVCER